MKIWLFPIEPLKERYSADWLEWFPGALAGLPDVSCEVIMGQRLTDKIEQGEFLDPYDTHYWKSTQMAAFVQQVHAKRVYDNDIVLLLDAWSPQITSLAYIRDTVGPKFKITGCLHAGTWDPWDYLSHKGLGRWASAVETGWMRAMDAVFLATKFHREQILASRSVPSALLHITGHPKYVSHEMSPVLSFEKRANVVVFPHRLAPEKCPGEFDLLHEMYERTYPGENVQWIRSKDTTKTKRGYYDLLNFSKVAVSTARQETWGNAMIEAAMMGCWPVAPAALSYPETLPGAQLYSTLEDAVAFIHAGLHADKTFAYPREYSEAWETAIEKMVTVCHSLLQQ